MNAASGMIVIVPGVAITAGTVIVLISPAPTWCTAPVGVITFEEMVSTELAEVSRKGVRVDPSSFTSPAATWTA